MSSSPSKPNKTALVRVRCTTEDHAHWTALAESSGQGISELVRQSMGRVRAFTPEDREHSRQVTRGLARIGNNLNQIARWANTHGEQAEAVEVISHLIALQRLVTELGAELGAERPGED